MKRLSAAALVCAVACGGKTDASGGGAAAPLASAASSIAATRATTTGAQGATSAGEPPSGAASARASDPRYRRALGEDDAARIRLANEVGAEELVHAIDDGGDVAKAAIAALPFAPDADLALGPIAARARATPPSARRGWLELLDALAARPRDQRDPLDLDGARAAFTLLTEVSKDTRATVEERALATSAARALAERGYATR